MVLLIFIFGVLLALGLFFIMADLLKLPRLATQRAMLSVGRQEKKQARSVEALLMGWAVKLAPHIHMDEYKRGRLKNTLAAAGLGTTPEEYTAFAIDSALTVCLVCSDGHEFEFSYPLTPAEQAQLWDKMDAYCRQQNGQSLEEARAALLQTQAEEGMEIRM